MLKMTIGSCHGCGKNYVFYSLQLRVNTLIFSISLFEFFHLWKSEFFLRHSHTKSHIKSHTKHHIEYHTKSRSNPILYLNPTFSYPIASLYIQTLVFISKPSFLYTNLIVGMEGTTWRLGRERVEGKGWERLGGWGTGMMGTGWGLGHEDGGTIYL